MNREEELAAENEALRAQLREMALDVLAASGQAQEAYEAQLAAEAEAARLRAEAEKIAAQRDEAVLRAAQAEEAKRAVEADLSMAVQGTAWGMKQAALWSDRAAIAEAELARIRSDRQKEQQP